MNIMPNNLGRQFSLHAKEYEDKAVAVYPWQGGGGI